MPNDGKSFAAPRALLLGFSPADNEGKRVVYCKPCVSVSCWPPTAVLEDAASSHVT
jgi:hypothetical protein